MKPLLEGKVAVITGGSSGIGRALPVERDWVAPLLSAAVPCTTASAQNRARQQADF